MASIISIARHRQYPRARFYGASYVDRLLTGQPLGVNHLYRSTLSAFASPCALFVPCSDTGKSEHVPHANVLASVINQLRDSAGILSSLQFGLGQAVSQTYGVQTCDFIVINYGSAMWAVSWHTGPSLHLPAVSIGVHEDPHTVCARDDGGPVRQILVRLRSWLDMRSKFVQILVSHETSLLRTRLTGLAGYPLLPYREVYQ